MAMRVKIYSPYVQALKLCPFDHDLSFPYWFTPSPFTWSIYEIIYTRGVPNIIRQPAEA